MALTPTDLIPVPSALGEQAHDHGSAEFLLNDILVTAGNVGPGNALGLTTRGIMPMPHRYTWHTIINYNGETGTYTSLTINLEGSLDGKNWAQLDQTTSATGEMRHVVNKPIRYVRANVISAVVAANNPTVTVLFGE
jgi:hypothetical protein